MTTRTKSKTDTGAAAAPETETSFSIPRPDSKIGKVVALLGREEGATLEELVKTTGWQVHTARAALTGLKKRGYEIERRKRDDASVYRAEVRT